MKSLPMSLVGVIALCAVPAAAGQKPTALNGAIQHRCVLECVWVKSHCSDSKSCGSFTMETCVSGCMDLKTRKKVLGAKAPAEWGTSIALAIEVCLPAGERYYLDDLRCADGKAPAYRRGGSVGMRRPLPVKANADPKLLMDPSRPLKAGEIDHHIIDRYEVKCGEEARVLFFDMYHCGSQKPWVAPRGFSRPPRG